jgi:hypothetical protein
MSTLLIHFLVICKLAGLTSLNACKDIVFFSNGKSGAESRKQKAVEEISVEAMSKLSRRQV